MYVSGFPWSRLLMSVQRLDDLPADMRELLQVRHRIVVLLSQTFIE